MTRDEHLIWCKKRALEYVNIGDLNQALVSMGSDLQKHPELKNHKGVQLGIMLLLSGKLNTRIEMINFINGFN